MYFRTCAYVHVGGWFPVGPGLRLRPSARFSSVHQLSPQVGPHTLIHTLIHTLGPHARSISSVHQLGPHARSTRSSTRSVHTLRPHASSTRSVHQPGPSARSIVSSVHQLGPYQLGPHAWSISSVHTLGPSAQSTRSVHQLGPSAWSISSVHQLGPSARTRILASTPDQPDQAHSSQSVVRLNKAGRTRRCRCSAARAGRGHAEAPPPHLQLAGARGITPGSDTPFCSGGDGKVIAFYGDTWPGRVPRLLTRDGMGSFI